MPLDALAKSLIILGIVILFFGLLLLLLRQVPFFGRLPGDIYITRDGFSCFFPIVSFLLLSLILTLLVNLLLRIIGR
jgi:hypothetical protein